MQAIVQVIAQALGKIGDAFDVFDLSFFVAGLLSLAVAQQAWKVFGFSPVGQCESVPDALLWLAVVYAAGLLSFAAGRWIRLHVMGHRGSEHADLWERAISAHRLKDAPLFKPYLPQDGAKLTTKDALAIHARCWAEVREDVSLAASMKLINRYWVFCATFDGVGFSGVLAIAVLLGGLISGSVAFKELLAPQLAATAVLALGAAVWACFREARRFASHQAEELCATMAWKVAHPSPVSGAGGGTVGSEAGGTATSDGGKNASGKG